MPISNQGILLRVQKALVLMMRHHFENPIGSKHLWTFQSRMNTEVDLTLLTVTTL